MNHPEPHLSESPRQSPLMPASVDDALSPETHVRTNKTGSGGLLNLAANALGAVLILGLGALGLFYFGRRPEVATVASRQDLSQEAPTVQTTEILVRQDPFFLTIDGEAATYRILTVGAEVSGRILEKAETARSGKFVNQGDVLFEIDAINYELDANRLKARVQQTAEELRAVEVDLQSSAAMLTLAEENNQLQKNHLDRMRSLFDQKGTSENEMDTAIQQELTSRNQIQVRRNELAMLTQQRKTREAAKQLAESELERTMTDLKRCRIVAPITGRIVDDMKEQGDYVKPGDTLVHISDSSRMEVKCSLKADELAWVWQQGQEGLPSAGSQTSQVSVTAAPVPLTASDNTVIAVKERTQSSDLSQSDRKADPFRMPRVPCEVAFEFQGVETMWEAYLDRYEGTGIDRNTRMFPCRVVVEQPEKTRVDTSPGGRPAVSPPTLLSGMYVTVRIPINTSVPLFSVPSEALRPGERLWVVRDNKVRIVPVQLVRIDNNMALVRQEGAILQKGDRTIVSPLASVVDGMTVTTEFPAVTRDAASQDSVESSAKGVRP